MGVPVSLVEERFGIKGQLRKAFFISLFLNVQFVEDKAMDAKPLKDFICFIDGVLGMEKPLLPVQSVKFGRIRSRFFQQRSVRYVRKVMLIPLIYIKKAVTKFKLPRKFAPAK